MTATMIPVGEARLRLDKARARRQTLVQDRAKALDEVGRLHAGGQPTKEARAGLRSLDDELEITNAALPHLEKTLAASEKVETDRATAAKRASLHEQADAARATAHRLAAVFKSVAGLHADLMANVEAMQTLGRELKLGHASGFASTADFAVRCAFAHAVRKLAPAGSEAISTIPPGYQVPVDQVIEVMLSEILT